MDLKWTCIAHDNHMTLQSYQELFFCNSHRSLPNSILHYPSTVLHIWTTPTSPRSLKFSLKKGVIDELFPSESLFSNSIYANWVDTPQQGFLKKKFFGRASNSPCCRIALHKTETKLLKIQVPLCLNPVHQNLIPTRELKWDSCLSKGPLDRAVQHKGQKHFATFNVSTFGQVTSWARWKETKQGPFQRKLCPYIKPKGSKKM